MLTATGVRIQRVFVLVFAAAGLRLCGFAGIVLFTVFHMRRAFDSRDVEYLLSRPLTRVSFLLSHAVSFSFLALLIAAFVSLAVLILTPERGTPGFLLWSASLSVEYLIMANVSLFFALVMKSPVTGTLSVFGLYVLARMIGQIFGIIAAGVTIPGGAALSGMMVVIGLIVPRLDLMAQSSWLVYGPGDDAIGYGFLLLQGGGYLFLVTMASLFDLVRKQF